VAFVFLIMIVWLVALSHYQKALWEKNRTTFDTPRIDELQTAPLDLDSRSFYTARRAIIELRLEEIRQGSAPVLLAECWSKHHNTYCRGVNWEKYSLETLQTIAACVGGSRLSALCRLLTQDHAGYSAGMPDLLLWRTFR